MKSKGTIALLVVLMVCSVITISFSLNLIAPSVPNQIYEPTLPPSNERVICLAFDDGWKTHLDVASILAEYNFSATFPIITSYVGYPAYMDWNDIASLAQQGNDIVSHTNTHCNLSSIDVNTLQSELADSRQILRSKGYAADVLIYPYGEGINNETVRNAVSKYYLMAAGTQTGQCNLLSVDRYSVNSIVIYHNTSLEDFASYLNGTQGSTVTILYYHKVSDENQDNVISIANFRAEMQYLKDNNYTIETISQLFLKQT